MVHRPFIQSGNLFELIGVSSELDELQNHNRTWAQVKEHVFYIIADIKAEICLSYFRP